MAQTSDPKPPALDSDADSSPAMPPSSWAKRPKFSGETNASDSGQSPTPNIPSSPAPIDLETGRIRPIPTVNATALTPQRANAQAPPQSGNDQSVTKRGDAQGGSAPSPPKHGHTRIAAAAETPASTPPQTARNGTLPQVVDDEFMSRRSHMKYELRDTPGLVPIAIYGFQHYLSMLGSLVLIPLVIVPAMGGDHEDTSMVVSTVLFVSGITTLLQANFGSRLPLIQGPSFVFLAPVLAIIKSPEFLKLNENSFKHIMKELQGAIIIASAFQTLLGYTGLITLLLRLINPLVVSSTIAAVGLSFYTYGFPQLGECLEIDILQILIVVIFSLYLRKVSLFGHRLFLIYAVPLGMVITWAIAFLLTETGAHKHKHCDVNTLASNMKSSPWFRFPYPFQFGTPVFNWKLAVIMCVVSVISSVDSVGSYHASSLMVASRPPTSGVVGRGIGVEGVSSILAGVWGTGTGSTTLTENVHTIAVTKMGSRKTVELGACVLVILSLVGKVGGLIASIPQVMVAGLLCIMWAMLTALGLSNLRYSESGSSRNIIIIGLSLFFSLSAPAYFFPSHAPFHTHYKGLNYVMNTLLSLHMVIAFVVAVVLDNTVPGSKQERGVYMWVPPEAACEPAVVKDYGLPFKIGNIFRWVRWVGL